MPNFHSYCKINFRLFSFDSQYPVKVTSPRQTFNPPSISLPTPSPFTKQYRFTPLIVSLVEGSVPRRKQVFLVYQALNQLIQLRDPVSLLQNRKMNNRRLAKTKPMLLAKQRFRDLKVRIATSKGLIDFRASKI